MADDWQVGDLALCVNLGGWFDDGFTDANTGPDVPGPKCGSIHMVVRVVVGPYLALRLEGWEGENAVFEADCFRKITPPEADEFDRETIDLMNGAPVGEPVA